MTTETRTTAQESELDAWHAWDLLHNGEDAKLIELDLSPEIHAELAAMRVAYRDSERHEQLSQDREADFNSGFKRLEALMLLRRLPRTSTD